MSENENRNESETPQSQPATGFTVLKAHIERNKIDFVLWCTRFATIVFTLNYLIPIFG